MNRSEYQVKEKTLASRVFLFSNLQRAIVAVALLAFVSASAMAQYPGGGGGTGTYPGGTRPSYGSKGAAIGGFVAGSAVGAGFTLLETSQSDQAARMRG